MWAALTGRGDVTGAFRKFSGCHPERSRPAPEQGPPSPPSLPALASHPAIIVCTTDWRDRCRVSHPRETACREGILSPPGRHPDPHHLPTGEQTKIRSLSRVRRSRTIRPSANEPPTLARGSGNPTGSHVIATRLADFPANRPVSPRKLVDYSRLAGWRTSEVRVAVSTLPCLPLFHQVPIPA